MQKDMFDIFEDSMLIGKCQESEVFGEYNKACIFGVIIEEFSVSHSNQWGEFYKTKVGVERRSGAIDYIPIIVSRKQLGDFPESVKGLYVEMQGEFRSYIRWSRGGKKSNLKVFLYSKNIKHYSSQEGTEEMLFLNEIFLKGIINTTPTYRETSSGKQISDFILKVRRNKFNCDVIPCIAWGKNAQDISKLKVGDEIQVFGRIQSREYLKKVTPDAEDGEIKTAYEVSISKFT